MTAHRYENWRKTDVQRVYMSKASSTKKNIITIIKRRFFFVHEHCRNAYRTLRVRQSVRENRHTVRRNIQVLNMVFVDNVNIILKRLVLVSEINEKTFSYSRQTSCRYNTCVRFFIVTGAEIFFFMRTHAPREQQNETQRYPNPQFCAFVSRRKRSFHFCNNWKNLRSFPKPFLSNAPKRIIVASVGRTQV